MKWNPMRYIFSNASTHLFPWKASIDGIKTKKQIKTNLKIWKNEQFYWPPGTECHENLREKLNEIKFFWKNLELQKTKLFKKNKISANNQRNEGMPGQKIRKQIGNICWGCLFWCPKISLVGPLCEAIIWLRVFSFRKMINN